MFKVSALLNVHCNAAVEQNIYSFNRDTQSTSNAWRYEHNQRRATETVQHLSHTSLHFETSSLTTIVQLCSPPLLSFSCT
jgi:hypothetical protein